MRASVGDHIEGKTATGKVAKGRVTEVGMAGYKIDSGQHVGFDRTSSINGKAIAQKHAELSEADKAMKSGDGKAYIRAWAREKSKG